LFQPDPVNELLSERMTTRVLTAIAIELAGQLALATGDATEVTAVLARAVDQMDELPSDPALFGVHQVGADPAKALGTAKVAIREAVTGMILAARRGGARDLPRN
jgi:hypothetical protein